jgi:hypothetical protein
MIRTPNFGLPPGASCGFIRTSLHGDVRPAGATWRLVTPGSSLRAVLGRGEASVDGWGG